jgi:prepilin-type N-terminal cleavage/methylation domain-containing protein
MKCFADTTLESAPSSRCRQGAFTLIEMMVAMAVLSLAVAAIITCNIAGLEFNEFVRPKVQNSQYARETLSRLIEEVRSANSTQVGTGTVSSFTAAAPNRPQRGNALRILTTTNATPYIYYFADSFSGTVQKIPLGSSNAVTIATSVTNANIFSMEDRSGTLLTNSQNNAVLSVLLQMLRPSSKSGMSDAYQIRSKTTRRNIL